MGKTLKHWTRKPIFTVSINGHTIGNLEDRSAESPVGYGGPGQEISEGKTLDY